MQGVQEVWEIIKLRNGILNDDKQAIAETYIKQVGQVIIDDINHDSVPLTLYFLWADMVSKLLLYDVPSLIPEVAENGGSIDYSNIKVGDTNVGSGSGSGSGSTIFASLTAKSLQNLLTDYHHQLGRYRRLRWC